MLKFKFAARDWQGKRISGLVEARRAKEATDLVKAKGLVVTKIELQRESLLHKIRLILSRISGGQITSFTRRFATMIEAGLPLTDSLLILKNQEKGKLRKVIEDVLAKIEGGSSLTQALGEHEDVFGSIYVASVRAGEEAGVLEKVLAQLADNLEKRQEFLGKIKSAMIYPVIVVIGMAGVMFIVMTFVVPKMMSLYSEFGTDLPWPTRVLMAISGLFQHFFWVAPLLVVGLVAFFRLFGKRATVKQRIDTFKLKAPIFGPLMEATIMTDISRTLAMLISTGVPLIDSVAIVGGSTGNAVFEKSFKRVSTLVEKGASLATAMKQEAVFPQILTEMVATGEQTGKLDVTLFNISRYFEMEANQKVKVLTSAIEPIIMVILGAGVGFLVFAVIMPIYDLTNQF